VNTSTNKHRPDISTEEIVRLHFEEKLSVRAIAELVGMSKSAISLRLRGAGYKSQITMRPIGHWDDVILPRAAEIVRSYDTPVTLRQLFYRLVSEELIANTSNEYGQLSTRTAKARREGWFPELMDRGRDIVVPAHWSSPAEVLQAAARQYRRPRTEGQEWTIYLGTEKAGLIEQLRLWFGNERGIPILPLGGYHSESFERDIATHDDEHDRPSVLLYAGDLDPSGEDIPRNLREYTDFDEFHLIALSLEQADAYALPRLPGKPKDSRAAAFKKKYGSLFQIELDAVEPNELHRLFSEAIEPYWDDDAHQAVLAREAEEREQLFNVEL
jgi:hypothetical protein